MNYGLRTKRTHQELNVLHELCEKYEQHENINHVERLQACYALLEGKIDVSTSIPKQDFSIMTYLVITTSVNESISVHDHISKAFESSRLLTCKLQYVNTPTMGNVYHIEIVDLFDRYTHIYVVPFSKLSEFTKNTTPVYDSIFWIAIMKPDHLNILKPTIKEGTELFYVEDNSSS